MTGLSNCSEFHHLMMVLSHYVKTEMCFIFLVLQMRRFFFHQLFICRSQGHFFMFLFFCTVRLGAIKG